MLDHFGHVGSGVDSTCVVKLSLERQAVSGASNDVFYWLDRAVLVELDHLG